MRREYVRRVCRDCVGEVVRSACGVYRECDGPVQRQWALCPACKLWGRRAWLTVPLVLQVLKQLTDKEEDELVRAKLPVGCKVEARWRIGFPYLPGTITKINDDEDRTYAIQYDNGNFWGEVCVTMPPET